MSDVEVISSQKPDVFVKKIHPHSKRFAARLVYQIIPWFFTLNALFAMKAALLFAAIMLVALSLSAVPFTLRNNSLRSIPLVIPGVMNPNLSPMSNSGVDLEVGQKIFFLAKGKKVLLLEVTAENQDQVIDVAALIAQRKREEGLR